MKVGRARAHSWAWEGLDWNINMLRAGFECSKSDSVCVTPANPRAGMDLLPLACFPHSVVDWRHRRAG